MTVPTTARFLLSRADLDFQLYDWLDVESLLKRERFAEHSRETFDDVLDLCATIAAERFAPHNKLGDSHEPELVEGVVRLRPEVARAVEAVGEAGVVGAAMGAEVGGLQLPQVLQTAAFAHFQAANIATWGYTFLSVANANLLLAHGSPDQIDTWVRPVVEGRYHGTMCLSEPQAGSSLSDITTRAEPRPDGTYRVFGNKMWISGGDHELGENIVHLVLAKIPGGPSGVKGISLFVVPKYLVEPDGAIGERNDVVVAGLNHKMGFRGTANTLLNFGEGAHAPGGEAGAVGYLVGEAHHGLAYMFHMMNEARVGVGAGAAALGYTGYLKALDYARDRTQGRLPDGKDPAAPQVPLLDHADVRRMLLEQKVAVEGALGLVLYCGRLIDEENTAPDATDRRRATDLLEFLTPIAKSWPSQWCLAANDLAIQVHGGYGYTREYDVEQHYRDNRLNPIHEGTHGIQGIDLLGRKTTMDRGAAFTALVEAVSATIERARGGSADDLARALRTSADRLVEVTGTLNAVDDRSLRLANASLYLEAVGDVVLAWIWLEQYLATGDQDDALRRGKRDAARYFFRYDLPRTEPRFALLEQVDRTTLDFDSASF